MSIKMTEAELLIKTKYQAKRFVNQKIKDHQGTKIYKAAETKSKVRDYICQKNNQIEKVIDKINESNRD
jgi:hypothetical protein